MTNQVSYGEGYEFELRFLVSEALTFTLGYSDLEVQNLTTLDGGGRFSFFGAEDIPQIDPALFYGGAAVGIYSLLNQTRRPSVRGLQIEFFLQARFITYKMVCLGL